MRPLRIAPHALWRREGEGIVLLEERSGEPYHLDAIGAFLFEALEVPHTYEELVARAREEYQGEEAAIREDVKDFVTTLLHLELLEALEEEGGAED